MRQKQHPFESELDLQKQDDSYERWFRAKVEEAISSSKPRIAHDQAMAEIRSRLEVKRKLNNAS